MPRATARLQFFAGFTLDDAVPIVPYLAALGISHLYASPLLKARLGSTHCYDIVDHSQINPELGGIDALRRLVTALRAQNMGLLLDIVPNHMGVGGADNSWWLDVLEWGHASRYAEFFDIDWTPPDASLTHKLLAPFLGAAYGEVLESGALQLKCGEAGGLYVEYHEHHFPISAQSAALVLHGEPACDDISHAFAKAARWPGRNLAYQTAAEAKAMLASFAKTPAGEETLRKSLARFDPAQTDGRRRLHELLQRQHYRLAWWRAAADEINWRRFFDINSLAGIRVEQPRVFDATHKFLLRLYEDGLIDGVRIDHIDGLADPRGYARKLRRAMESAGQKRPPEAAKGPPYIVVEKILNGRERLDPDWRTDGTTGYRFMDQVSAVLHDPAGEALLSALWTNITGRTADFAQEEEAARRQILRDTLASELLATSAALHRIARRDLATRDYTLTSIRRGLTEILAHFPVYRIYAGRTGASEADIQVMDRALAGARRHFRAADVRILDLLRRWLVEEAPRLLPPGPRRAERLRTAVRFQQLSAPVAAKSVEDTAFYRFGRLLSRNEVGSNPGQFALSPVGFHAAMLDRAKKFPGALLATATHDHKRGEDTRARLAVLSEIPDAWETAITRWMRLNAIIRQEVGPSPADELMLYQTLVAAWPLGLVAQDQAGLDSFTRRVAGWLEKSVREAKLVSEWAAPNEEYETAARNFLSATLDPSRPVLGEIIAFAERLGPAGALNGLAQTLLRLTAPGVPDLYQGTEFWDQSLVDPDNRRPVDFAVRQQALRQGLRPAALLESWASGAVKQAVIARTLALRQEWPALFAKGNYIKLEAEGAMAPHILAFSRSENKKQIVVAVTRLAARFLGDAPLLPAADWGDTALTLPGALWVDVFGERHVTGARIEAKTLFADFPIALLRSA
ncbi:MAG TPA: malto-oligosyltrehalose synthase [Acidocella sp.]|uniref:malto-oligosyltrehalose synthase n=1 Tax=Acidocella sp. TaxID=50710 RepID=UPI002B7F231D|nr:malto-oligosyltrehalose synthase [Acidocella sp.]HVE21032.1 malto-oligosyltrehalose synthase [Acidocella sp.]